MAQEKLDWQSKLVLLVVLPFAGGACLALAAMDGRRNRLGGDLGHWAERSCWALVTWRLRAATPAGALTGAVITASLMFSTCRVSLRTLAHGADPRAGGLAARLPRNAAWPGEEKNGWARRKSAEGDRRRRWLPTWGLRRWYATGPAQFWLMDSAWLDRAARRPCAAARFWRLPRWPKRRRTPFHRRSGRCLAESRA